MPEKGRYIGLLLYWANTDLILITEYLLVCSIFVFLFFVCVAFLIHFLSFLLFSCLINLQKKAHLSLKSFYTIISSGFLGTRIEIKQC